jgi:valyl-tRNA synthetase
VPFHTVYLHGLVRNEDGRKISKSMEDAWRYDPLYMIDEYGQDPLRFTLLTGSTPGTDMRLSPARVEANRNFGNKIWQAARFVLANLDDAPPPLGEPVEPPPAEPVEAEPLAPSTSSGAAPLSLASLAHPADRWIVSRYHALVASATRLIEGYQLGEAGRQMYDFLWGEYCDWYIEMTKVRFRENSQEAGDVGPAQDARRVLVYVLEGCLRLLHPYMPFVTETIWQYLPHAGEALIVAPWPQAGETDAESEAGLEGFMELVRGIRNARTEYDVEPGRRVAAIISAGENLPLLERLSGELQALARIDPQRLQMAGELAEPPQKALTLVAGGYACYLPLAALVDLDRERARIQGELEALQSEISRSEALLANPGFVSKAPEAVVQRERDKLADLGQSLATLQERLTSLTE